MGDSQSVHERESAEFLDARSQGLEARSGEKCCSARQERRANRDEGRHRATLPPAANATRLGFTVAAHSASPRSSPFMLVASH